MKKISRDLIIIMILITILFSFSTLYTKSEANEYKDVTTYSDKTMLLNAWKGKYKGKDVVDIEYNGEAYKEYNFHYKKKSREIKHKVETGTTGIHTGKAAAEKELNLIKSRCNGVLSDIKYQLCSTPAENKWKIQYKITTEIIDEHEETKFTGWTKVSNLQSVLGTAGMNNVTLIRTETRTVYNITVKTKEQTEYKTVTPHSTKAAYLAACKGRYNGANIVDVVYNGEAYKEYKYKYEKINKRIDPDWSMFHWYSSEIEAKNGVESMKKRYGWTDKDFIYRIRAIEDESAWSLEFKTVYYGKETGETIWTKDSNFQSVMGTSGIGDVTLLRTDTRSVYNITVITDGQVTNNENENTQNASSSSNQTQSGASSNQTGTINNTTKIEESETDKKQTETIDKGTLSDNAVEFTKKIYMAMLEKTKEEADKNINKDSLIVKDIVEGKTDAAGLIKYFEELEKPYVDLSFDEYCKYMYKAILQKDITDSELEALKEQYGEDENFQSEILGNIINSNEFKALCEKYSINVGTYTASRYNSNITEEKAITFVKNLYSTLMNKIATDDEITKIVKNITDGKITASGIYKAFFESDEFKNQKVSDDKYVEMLGKVCWNKDLTDEQNKEYTNKLINGTTRNELLKEFISATDCTALCDEYGLSKGNYEAGKLRSTNALATDFVKNVHNATLGESSKMTSTSSPGLITGSLSAADVIQLYVESSNFENRIKSENLTNSDYIKCLFNACLQRDASSTDEAKQYENKIDQSYKPSVLAEFFKLDEYKKLCNSYYLVAGNYTDNKENNQAESKTTNYGSGGAKITTKERTLSNGKTVKYTTKVEFDISAGLKGDLDGDNHVSIEDATLLLSYVATQELNYIKPTDEVLKMADVDGDKEITVEDAQYILQYYAMNAAQLNPTWEEAIEAAKKYDEDGTIPTKDTSTTEDKENTNNNNSETVDSKNFCVDITKSNSMPVCNEEQLTKMINNSDVTQEAKNNMLSVVSDLVKYQNEYKVNAVFFMAVTKTDSKWGTEWKNIDSKTHNWTGLLGTKGGGYTGSDGRTFNSYSSYSEATKDWFELISDADGYYFGSQKYTVDDIAQTYANAQWGQVVSENIQKLYSLISNENIATDNKGFAKVASERKKYIADNGYIYGHEDPRTTKQVNSVSYISWALLDYGYNATSNGVLINDVSGLRSWLSKSGFKQTYNGKTLSTNEAGLQAGDIVIEGVENGQYTHTQIYAGKNESGQDIWYSAGNNKSIATQPGKDNFSNPYESDHYIVEVYREESKGNYVDTSKTENNYKTNGKDETEKTGIEGIFSVGDKKYNIYCQSKGSWSNRPYWDGTVATDGDAPTCIAIIGSGYGKNITPADVATQCETAAGLKVGEVNPGTGLGSYQNVTNAFKHYGIKVSEYTEDIDYNKIKNHLMQKKTIMLNVSGNYGPRSTSGHYITILGYDESQDKVFIGDTVSNCSGWWSTETVLSKAKYIWYVDE